MIPDATLYSGAIGIFTSLAVIAAGIAIKIWQQATQKTSHVLVSDIIERKTRQLDERTAEFVKPFLGNLLLLTDGGITEEDVEEHLEESVSKTEFSIEDLEALLKTAMAVRHPLEQREQMHEAYKWSYGGFAFVALGSIGCAITLSVMAISGFDFSFWPPDMWDVPIVTIALLVCVCLYTGIVKFKRANRIDAALKQSAIVE